MSSNKLACQFIRLHGFKAWNNWWLNKKKWGRLSKTFIALNFLGVKYADDLFRPL